MITEELSLESLLDEVVEALEEAKQLGRNQLVIVPVIQEEILNPSSAGFWMPLLFTTRTQDNAGS